MRNTARNGQVSETVVPIVASLWSAAAPSDRTSWGSPPAGTDWAKVVGERLDLERERLAAFRTPVTEETLRRQLG